ncbi:hypothetical protein GCM10023212_36210 [Luteolibacter yonseiensis]
MAFSQILVAGLALAKRYEESRVPRVVVKEVPKYITVRVPVVTEPEKPVAPIVSRPPMPEPAAPTFSPAPLPAPTPVAAPAVGDPRSEKMVREARQARVAGDMVQAIVKLENALTQSPDDPNVHYELGLVHEQMGVFDTASAHYEKVFQMGVSKAGVLYEQAAAKLRDGFDTPSAMGKLSLGQVLMFKDPNDDAGEKVTLTIPSQKAPGEELDLDQVSVEVRFFLKNGKGEIIEEGNGKEWVTEEKWLTLPFDYAEGEEKLRMVYTIPRQNVQNEHLYGERTYYGQVVSLLYKGDVVDVRAWPPHLAAKVGPQPNVNSGGLPSPDTLPPDFDPNLPLLPPLPSQ